MTSTDEDRSDENQPAQVPASMGEDAGSISEDADSATGQVLDEDEIGDGKATVDEPTAGALDPEVPEPGGEAS